MKFENLSSTTLSYLYYIIQQFVSQRIFLFDIGELISQAERVGLEVKVSVLSPRNLVLVHVSISGLHGDSALKRSVQIPCSFPVLAVLVDTFKRNSCGSKNDSNFFHFSPCSCCSLIQQDSALIWEGSRNVQSRDVKCFSFYSIHTCFLLCVFQCRNNGPHAWL